MLRKQKQEKTTPNQQQKQMEPQKNQSNKQNNQNKASSPNSQQQQSLRSNAVDYNKYLNLIERTPTLKVNGVVVQVVGLTIEARGLKTFVGELCQLYHRDKTSSPVQAEVVGFRQENVLLMPLGELRGIRPGSLVVPTGETFQVSVGYELLGKVLDGLGKPLEDEPLPTDMARFSVDKTPLNPLKRTRIKEVLPTGIRAIDGLLTCGQGQRIGIFAGSGVGKSTLLGMIARHSEADVNVIGLIGERGREVLDFIERDLGDGLKHSVVVVATSDQPALIRIKGAMVTATIAEYFRSQGKKVMLMMDSITRLAMAQREVGLAIGEPPATKGYTPSVFAMLPKILERAGTGETGSITALYTVLVDGDDFNEPISDAVRGILDGHIMLSRDLAAKNHYPAIDVLASISRLMPDITQEKHQKAAGTLKDLLAVYRDAEDLINIGAYVKGSDPKIDKAQKYIEKMRNYLKQDMNEKIFLDKAIETLEKIFK